MKFLSLVQQGIEKSNKSLAAMAEVDSIFDMINEDLKHYPGGELRLSRTLSNLGRLTTLPESLLSVTPVNLKQDTITLSLKSKEGTFSEDVAGWKQRTTGYPCLIKFDGQELTCGTSAHLMSGLSELLASIGFGNAVNRLEKRANAPENDQKPAAARAPARTVTKAVSKPSNTASLKVKDDTQRSSGSSTKPAVAKAAAKAAPKKRAAKKPDNDSPEDSFSEI